jgi:Dyp-type peroxidase family
MAISTDLEPLLDWDDIQGNVLGGFHKDYQTLLGFKFGDPVRAKAFLRDLAAWVTPLREVVQFKAERRRRMKQTGAEPRDMRATWVAAAFSFDGLRALTADAAMFLDHEFRNGLPASSPRLGDPAGSTASWKTGAPGHVPDLLLIVAADSEDDCNKVVGSLATSAVAAGRSLGDEETGRDLGTYSDESVKFPSGHEHFGFKDGVSQPGIRGVLPNGSFLTPRLLPPDSNDDEPAYAAPGQPLVCAGQFVLGYAQQIDTFPRVAGPPVSLGTVPGAAAPGWARNGSFLVFRRLRQDVGAFRDFVAQAAAQLGRPDLPAPRLAALLVGRWPSGAPVIRSPTGDDPAQATADRINAFAFGDDNAALHLPNDSQGVVCPVAAHIRKVNPRDEDTDQGAASATLVRRILRRGIPYGPPLADGASDPGFVDRGLLFLSYQASISLQFEFLASQWMNNSILPRNPSGLAKGLGFDMVVGQNTTDRTRFAYIRSSPPGTDDHISTQNFSPKDWIVPTGGGYFFTPARSAIKEILARMS